MASFYRGQSLAYLQGRTGLTDEVGADMVAAELGDLPLGLAQAAATIRGQRLAYLVYLERLRLVPVADLLGRVPSGDYPYSAAAALLLSIPAVEASDSSGLIGGCCECLRCCPPMECPAICWLAQVPSGPTVVRRPWIQHCSSVLPDPYSAGRYREMR